MVRKDDLKKRLAGEYGRGDLIGVVGLRCPQLHRVLGQRLARLAPYLGEGNEPSG